MGVTALSLLDADGVLGAVGDGQARLLLELRRDRPVADDHRLAVVVDVEQLGCEGVTPVVALALLPIHANVHPVSVDVGRPVPVIRCGGGAVPAGHDGASTAAT